MNRTARAAAVTAAAALLLAACGSSEPAETGPEQETSAEHTTDESDSWPIVEDEDGNVVENPEDEPMDDGGETPVDGSTDELGNQISVIWDDEELMFDMDALTNGEFPTSGSYYLEGTTGVKILAEVDAEGPAAMEGLRESFGAEPLSYIRFDVDNREGTEEILVLELNMYDAEGKEYTFKTFTNYSNEWLEATDYRVTEEQETLLDELGDVEGANVGQRNEQWLIGPADLPDEVAHIQAHAEVWADEFYPVPVL